MNEILLVSWDRLYYLFMGPLKVPLLSQSIHARHTLCNILPFQKAIDLLLLGVETQWWVSFGFQRLRNGCCAYHEYCVLKSKFVINTNHHTINIICYLVIMTGPLTILG